MAGPSGSELSCASVAPLAWVALMATQLFLRDGGSHVHRGDNTTNLVGAAVNWFSHGLYTTRGVGVSNAGNAASVNGPTAGIEAKDTLSSYEWISFPLDADTTISGTITANLWGQETNMSANGAINVHIQRLDSQGAIISTIANSARTTELAFAGVNAVNNFTVTPTSTSMNKGDRIRLRVYFDDAGTMATGFTFNLGYNGTTAAVDGDSYISFTETFGFLTAEPAGTTMYLTDTAGPAVGANVEKELSLSRGAGSTSIVVNTPAGYAAPTQWTDTGGGTAVEWYSKPLAAFTLDGLVRVCTWPKEATIAGNAGMRYEIAICNSDGSSPAIWGANDFFSATNASSSTNTLEIPTTEAAWNGYVAGDTTSVTAGQRIRLRVFIDDTSSSTGAAIACTMFYAGTSGGVSGDSFIILPQSVTELTAAPPPLPMQRSRTWQALRVR